MYFLDTNILVRWVHGNAPDHSIVVSALRNLQAQGETLCITAQNLVEFWNVATRPQSVNGLGLSPERTAQEVRGLRTLFTLLPETPEILDEWLSLVESTQVQGRQVHDARIAAVMRVYGITHLLTFNAKDFARYGVTAVEPQDVPTFVPPENPQP